MKLEKAIDDYTIAELADVLATEIGKLSNPKSVVIRVKWTGRLADAAIVAHLAQKAGPSIPMSVGLDDTLTEDLEIAGGG